MHDGVTASSQMAANGFDGDDGCPQQDPALHYAEIMRVHYRRPDLANDEF